MEPRKDNRISLASETDRFGQRLPHLELHESAQMKASVHRSLRTMAEILAGRGIKPVVMGEEHLPHLRHYGGYGYHHMGATRMSRDPADGVVDADCRVHGLDNLYVASSSVFVTGGAANPTLTLAALSLRLAEHLAGRLNNRD